MSNSLWPDFSTLTPPRGLREMLYDAAGDIDTRTNGAIQFYVDTLGVSGAVKHIRHNCYLRVVKTRYTHLLFQANTSVPGPWPATVTTPEGDKYSDIQDEAQLRAAIEQILQRERTKEIVLYLLSTVR
jgi:hypothetical protein